MTPTPLRRTFQAAPVTDNGWRRFWKCHRIWDIHFPGGVVTCANEWHVENARYPHMKLVVYGHRRAHHWKLRSGGVQMGGRCRGLPDALRRAYAVVNRALVRGYRAEWAKGPSAVYQWDVSSKSWTHVADMLDGWPTTGDGIYARVGPRLTHFTRVRGPWRGYYLEADLGVIPTDQEITDAAKVFRTTVVAQRA